MTFESFVKYGVELKNENGKKKVSRIPKNWNKLKVSVYNNEDNFAILTGAVNNILVIDIDNKEEMPGLVWFEKIFGKIEKIDTLVTKTINNGYHVYFTYDSRVKNKNNFLGKHIDILVDNKCVYEGKGYTILKEANIKTLTNTEILSFTKDITNTEILDEVISNNNDNLWKVLDNLSEYRYQNYEDWIKVGFCLLKQENGNNLFHKFSMKSSKYDKNIVENKWQELISSDDYDGYKLQPKNLYDWLKNDNLEMFKELNEPNHDKIINEMNEITKVHSVINDKLLTKDKMLIEASIFDNNSILSCHNLLNKSCKDTCLVTRCNNHGVKIFCSNCNFSFPETWLKIQPDKAPYIYNIVVNNTTEDINNKDTYQVSQKINGYLGHSLIYIDKNIWYVYNDTNGLYEQKTDNFIGKKINKLISELKTNNNEEDWIPWIDKLNYKKNIIDELKMENELQDKEDIFDQNPYLLGFNSGVLDLKTKEHRKAKKNEFVTMKCKIEYDMDCSTDLAEKVLEDIFPNKEEREYVLNRFALCLEGINREQTFTFNYGFKASNGKSYLMRKLEEILGEYADNFPSNLITSKMKAAGESNTSLACFYKKRFMSCSEPEGNTKLNTNFIKLITGDNFKARNLFSNDVVIKPSFNIFICCNVLPSFDVYDKGISRRVRLVEFDTEFVDTPKRKGQKQIIQFTGEEELEISKGLFKLMIDKYFELSDKNFKYFEPKSLESMRKLYLNDNKDTITDILLNNYQLGDDKDFVPLKDIKKLLKSNDIVEKDALTLKKIVETTFPGTFFKSEKRVSTTKKIYNVITNMKLFSQ